MLEHLPQSAAEDAVLVLRHRLGMSTRKSRSAAETIAQTVLYHAGLHEWANSGGALASESLARMVGILNAGDPLPERRQAIRTISAQTSASEADATKMLDLLLPIILGGVHQIARKSRSIS
jgi:hypothetical protein